MWATWLEEKSSHCRTLKTESCEGTGKALHSSADPSPKQTLAYKYCVLLSNPQLIFYYTGLTLRCRTLCCPLGGAAGRWASHSFCPELRSQRLPTNQNLYSTGTQKRPSDTSPQGVGHQYVSVEWLNIKPAPSGYWQPASNSCWGLPGERWRLRGGFWEKRSATQSDI